MRHDPTGPGRGARRDLPAILAGSGFRHLLGVRLSGHLGDGLFQAGLAGSVFFNPQRATGALAIAAAFAVLLVPYSTLGPFAGVFLDRWSRRQVLFVANAVRAALVVPAALLIWSAAEGLTLILLALAIVALNRFVLAGLSAGLPHVAETGRLVTANSLANTAGSVTYAASLSVAAGVLHHIGTGYHPYALIASSSALAYAGAAVLTLVGFRRAALGPEDTVPSGSLTDALAATARGLVAGVRHLTARAAAWQVVLAQGLHRGAFGVLTVMTLLLYRNYFYPGRPTESIAGLLPIAVATATGSLLAALATPAASRRIGYRRWVVLLLAMLGVGVPVLCLPANQVLFVTGAGMIGLAAQGIKIVSDTVLQVECEDDFRGRVFSVNDTAYNLFFVAGTYTGALVLPTNGRSPAVVIAVGAAYLGIAGWFAAVSYRQVAPRAA